MSSSKKDITYRESDKDVWEDAKFRMNLGIMIYTAMRHLNERLDTAKKTFDKLIKG